MAWKIEFGGRTLRETEVTAAHLSMVADIVGEDVWENANPMHSPRVLAAWCAVVALPNSPEDGLALVSLVGSMPISELIAAVTEDDAPLHAVDTKAG